MNNVKRVIRFETHGPANTGMPAMQLAQAGFLRKFYITYADPEADTRAIDSADGGVIVLNAQALQKAKEKLDTTDPFVIKADPPVQHDSNAFTNDAGNFFIGMWDSTAFESEMLPFPCYEFVQLLEGEITITEQDGTVNVFVAGDVFLVPEGTVCSWKTTGYVKKFYCMLDTSG